MIGGPERSMKLVGANTLSTKTPGILLGITRIFWCVLETFRVFFALSSALRVSCLLEVLQKYLNFRIENLRYDDWLTMSAIFKHHSMWLWRMFTCCDSRFTPPNANWVTVAAHAQIVAAQVEFVFHQDRFWSKLDFLAHTEQCCSVKPDSEVPS